jgi:ubiquinone/menaquinone biosynthesis C-methylase UbiE
MQFKDYFSAQADTYAKYRPKYPEEMFAFLSSLCPEHELAWDCATGNGQAANSLVNYFNKVIATDASDKQLSNAKPHEKIEYRLALAEDSSITPGSVDLVTVAAAVHWFDFDKFYKEVNRVLKPKGVIAVWTYNDALINDKVNIAMEKLHRDILGSYWPKESRVVMNRYKDLPFPFERTTTPKFSYESKMDLNMLEGYLLTWSASQRYINDKGKNPVDEIRDELTAAWGNANEVKKVVWELTLIVGRKK